MFCWSANNGYERMFSGSEVPRYHERSASGKRRHLRWNADTQNGIRTTLDTKWPAGILTQGVTFIPLFGQKNIMTGNFSSFKTPIWKTGRLAFLCSVAEIFVFLSNQTSSVYAAEGILKSMLHLKQPFCLKFYVKFRVNENLYDWILSLDTVDIITCTT